MRSKAVRPTCGGVRSRYYTTNAVTTATTSATAASTQSTTSGETSGQRGPVARCAGGGS